MCYAVFCFSFAHNAFSAPLWKAMDAYQAVCLHCPFVHLLLLLSSLLLLSFSSICFGSFTFSIAPSENVSAMFWWPNHPSTRLCLLGPDSHLDSHSKFISELLLWFFPPFSDLFIILFSLRCSASLFLQSTLHWMFFLVFTTMFQVSIHLFYFLCKVQL